MSAGDCFGIASANVLLSVNTAPRCTASNSSPYTMDGGCGAAATAKSATHHSAVPANAFFARPLMVRAYVRTGRRDIGARRNRTRDGRYSRSGIPFRQQSGVPMKIHRSLLLAGLIAAGTAFAHDGGSNPGSNIMFVFDRALPMQPLRP